MIDFNNFKIKRGPAKDLHDPRLIIEEGYWYLSTDTAELFVGIVVDGIPQLKQINSELSGDVTVDLTGYATEDFVREAIGNIDIPQINLEGYATETFVQGKIDEIEIPEAYDDSELRNLINEKANTEHEHTEYSLVGHKHDEYLTEHQDLSEYAKLENIPDVSNFITEIPAEYITEEELNNKGYAKESYVLEEIAKAALEGNDVDLSAYATKEYVAEELGKINIPEEYDDTELRALISEKADKEHAHEQYLTEHQNISHLATKEEIPSIEGLATEKYVNDAIAAITPEVEDVKSNVTTVATTLNSTVLPKVAKVDEILPVVEKVTTEIVPVVEELKPVVEELKTTAATQEWVNEQNYTNEDKVLELIENNASSKIGIDFTTNITVGGLQAGTTITKDMTIGQLLYRMLYCEHDFIAVECGKPMICEYCGAEGPIAEHDPVINEGHEATCGIAGRTDEIYCGRCGEILEPAEEIPALEHIPSSSLDYSEEPTCTEVGYIKTRCELCGDVVDVQEVPALGHEFVDGICIRCGEVDPNYNPDQPEVIEGTRGDIINNELSMYSVNRDGELISKDFEVVEFTPEEATQAPTESCFYQIKDDSGEIVEFGYQDLQIVNDEMYYIIALPKSVDYNSDKVKVQSYDDEEGWMNSTKLKLVSDVDTVNSLCDEAGVDISHIDTSIYTVWVLEDTCSGKMLRYIIND